MSFEQLATEVQGKLFSEKAATKRFQGVAIDSRAVRSGELFIAIRGAHNDGHNFIEQALKRSAAGVMTDSRFKEATQLSQRTQVVAVENTHRAMMLLAQKYRRQTDAKIIGITGSNGKTTTKEFTYALLEAVEQGVYRSPGNLNNLYGAPLALLAMPRDTKIGVLEMGISTNGEMTRLTQIVRPDIAVITNIGPSHLEFLSTVEDVARSKLEIVTASPAELSVVVNADDELLLNETNKIRTDIVTFAINNEADFKPEAIENLADGKTRVTIENNTFLVNVAGRYQVYNLLAAYAACRTAGYDFQDVDTSTVELKSAPMRGETIQKNSIRIINDAYNANPDSVKAGLDAFESIAGGRRRIIILGDMLELGKKAEHYHRWLGGLLKSYSFDLAVIVGQMSEIVLDSAVNVGVPVGKLHSFAVASDAAGKINELVGAGDLVYVKGSRGVGLEKIIDAIAPAEEKS